MAWLIPRLSLRERLREALRRFAMSTALDGFVDAREFAGKRVLVGAQHPLDILAMHMDVSGWCYGIEFHADVVTALPGDQVPRPMPSAAQWL